MLTQRKVALQLTLFLVAFFALWTLRATWGYAIDESIASPIPRAAYSSVVKLVLWVIPAVTFAYRFRNPDPAKYLGLSVWPTQRCWRLCLAVTGAFLLATALMELGLGKKTFSITGLATLPLTLWFLQLGLSPWIEEVLFRGLVMKELLQLLPEYLATILTSLLFMGIHLPYWLAHGGATRVMAANAVGVFIFSLLASWLYARSESIWPPTIAHIANNVLASLLVVHPQG